MEGVVSHKCAPQALPGGGINATIATPKAIGLSHEPENHLPFFAIILKAAAIAGVRNRLVGAVLVAEVEPTARKGLQIIWAEGFEQGGIRSGSPNAIGVMEGAILDLADGLSRARLKNQNPLAIGLIRVKQVGLFRKKGAVSIKADWERSMPQPQRNKPGGFGQRLFPIVELPSQPGRQFCQIICVV